MINEHTHYSDVLVWSILRWIKTLTPPKPWMPRCVQPRLGSDGEGTRVDAVGLHNPLEVHLE